MTGSVSQYFVGVKGGLVMSMIAFSIVFLVIIGLMLMMIAIKYMAAAIEGGKGSGNGNGNGNKAVAAPQQQAPASPSAPARAVSARPEDDGVLMAVISAAIAATLGSAARVVSFSPVVKAPAATSWKFVAKMSNIEGFQD